MLQILLFHADAGSGDRIRKVLADHACDAELTHVRNVTGFLAALEQWRFDAILLQYAPPPSEGSAVLAAARQWWSATPVIALCAPASEREGRLALREGAVEYVPEDRLPQLTSTIHLAARGARPKPEQPRAEAAG
jgi:CheY-like chemotaxis protein